MTEQEFKRWHDWGRAPGLTWLGRSSRSDKTGQEFKKCHEWARAPGVTWLDTFSLFSLFLALKPRSFFDFHNFYCFCLLLSRSFFLFYVFLIFSSIFLLSLLDCVAVGCQQCFNLKPATFFVVSLINLCAGIFRLCPGVPFGLAVCQAVLYRMRLGARPLDAVVPVAHLVSLRDTSVRMVRTVQRWARGYTVTSVEKQSTAPRETLLDCPSCCSFFVLDFLYTAAAASRCLSTEWLLERLRFPLSREAGDLHVL